MTTGLSSYVPEEFTVGQTVRVNNFLSETELQKLSDAEKRDMDSCVCVVIDIEREPVLHRTTESLSTDESQLDTLRLVTSTVRVACLNADS